MNTDPHLNALTQHVRAIRGFYIHASIFAVVIALLIVINAGSGSGWWVQWPLIGWGIGLACHALGVYGLPSGLRRLNADWEARKIAELRKTPRS
jgi:2TM domain